MSNRKLNRRFWKGKICRFNFTQMFGLSVLGLMLFSNRLQSCCSFHYLMLHLFIHSEVNIFWLIAAKISKDGRKFGSVIQWAPSPICLSFYFIKKKAISFLKMLYYSAILSIVLMLVLLKHWRSIASITCYPIKSNVFIITLSHTGTHTHTHTRI